jgi:HSP20 family protein
MITRWNDPSRELESFRNQISRLFGETFPTSRADEAPSLAAWAPPVDITETPDQLVFQVELPGFSQEDLSLRAENGVLTLEGERKFEKESEKKAYHRVERAYGRFVRAFSLPVNVDPEKINATLVDGLLTVELPKREEAKPKSIPIGIGSAKQIPATKK